MPSLSFQGASDFSITGGNFCEIGGHVLTCNFNHSPRQQRSNPLPDHEETPTRVPPDRSERRQRRSVRREPIKPLLALSFPEPLATDISASRTIASPATTSESHSRVSSLHSLGNDSDDLGNGDNSAHLISGSRHSIPPSEPEEDQYTGPSDPTHSVPQATPLQSSNLTPLVNFHDLGHPTPVDQQQILSPAWGALRPRYPDVSPNRSSTDPGRTTYLPRGPSPLVPPRPSSADSLRPQRTHTESPQPLNHQAFGPPFRAPVTPGRFRLEEPTIRFARPQAQHDTAGYASTTSLLKTMPQSPLWTPGSISRWSHGVRPEDGFALESYPVSVPESHLCQGCGGMVRSYPPPPLPLIPASVPEHHQLLYNHPHTLPWGPLAPQHPYQGNGICDGFGYGHNYGRVLYSSGGPGAVCPSYRMSEYGEKHRRDVDGPP